MFFVIWTPVTIPMTTDWQNARDKHASRVGPSIGPPPSLTLTNNRNAIGGRNQSAPETGQLAPLVVDSDSIAHTLRNPI